MVETELILTGIKLVTVAAGFFIVYLGFKAWLKNREKTILWLTVGMLVLTLGAITEGAAYQGPDWDPDRAHIFEAVVTLLGFLILVYSLRAK